MPIYFSIPVITPKCQHLIHITLVVMAEKLVYHSSTSVLHTYFSPVEKIISNFEVKLYKMCHRGQNQSVESEKYTLKWAHLNLIILVLKYLQSINKQRHTQWLHIRWMSVKPYFYIVFHWNLVTHIVCCQYLSLVSMGLTGICVHPSRPLLHASPAVHKSPSWGCKSAHTMLILS